VIEIYQDQAGEWRWRVKADNGEVVAVGEGYTRREDAERGLRAAAEACDQMPDGDE
jgi:uncharacterized protein YegP (UPF0339 family)